MSETKPTKAPDPLVGIGTLLQLEQNSRKSEDLLALHFLVANETWRLVQYDQAAVIQGDGKRVCAISGVSNVDRNTALAHWLRALVKTQREDLESKKSKLLDANSVAAELAEDWRDNAKPFGILLKLSPPRELPVGWLWLTRSKPFTKGEISLLERLTETYAHSWDYLLHQRSTLGKVKEGLSKRWLWIGGAVVVLALMALPVSQTTLAPGEIVPKSPNTVSSPLDGVVKRVLVEPYQKIDEGTPLFELDRARFEAEVELSSKVLAIAQADFLKATQEAFFDPASNAKRAVLKAKVDESEAQLQYARQVLAQTRIDAPRDGVIIFGSREEWIGRPVRVGEAVMTVADPSDVQLKIEMPTSDAIILEPGANIRLFLDIDPLSPLPATLRSTSYAPQRSGDGVLIYDLRADFIDGTTPRLGLTGTARLQGDTVPLAYYLMRKPLIYLRKVLAW